MKNHSMSHNALMLVGAIVLVIAGAGAGYVFASKTEPAVNPSGTGTATTMAAIAERAKAGQHNESDVMFAQMMVPHHQQAIQMAELAETRAESAGVKSLAAKIKAAQQPEIDKMNSWLTSWGAVTADMAGMHHSMGSTMSDDDMAKLSTQNGAAFDRAFLAMMIEHHNGAIDMAKDELSKGQDPDSLALAASIQVTQHAEVAQMKAMLK